MQSLYTIGDLTQQRHFPLQQAAFPHVEWGGAPCLVARQAEAQTQVSKRMSKRARLHAHGRTAGGDVGLLGTVESQMAVEPIVDQKLMTQNYSEKWDWIGHLRCLVQRERGKVAGIMLGEDVVVGVLQLWLSWLCDPCSKMLLHCY